MTESTTTVGRARRGAEVAGVGLFLPSPLPEMLSAPPGGSLDGGPAYLCPDVAPAGVISANMLRRLGRAQRMTLAAAARALEGCPAALDAGGDVAVTVGTGLGTLGETTAFLENMISRDEAEPRPARFINSVHNSPAAQVAIAFGLTAETKTFIHGGISFELALWQALRIVEAGRARFAVACGVDEASPYVVTVGGRHGWWRKSLERLAPMSPADEGRAGTIPGEGAAAIVVGRTAGPGSRCAGMTGAARVAAVVARPLAKPGLRHIDAAGEADFIERALGRAGLALKDVDLLISGANGDCAVDGAYDRVLRALSGAAGRDIPHGVFKQTCGEYCASSGVGIALAARTVREGALPGEVCIVGGQMHGASNVVFYGLAQSKFHSVCVVTA